MRSGYHRANSIPRPRSISGLRRSPCIIARGVEIRRKGYASSRSEMEWNIQDGDYRYNLGVINEDRRAKGLPLIEFE